MSDQNTGRLIGKYKIVEHLGKGGMAEVYKAYQESLDRYVALKLMHPFLAADENFLSRFKREARAMAVINHPHIVSVYDFDIDDETYYIVMEYIPGGTLKALQAQFARAGTRMPLGEALTIILQVSDALAYAHGRGMIHRDIKPANVMINERGDAILTDFGIAKMMSGPSYTITGAMIGTPAYMAPEQAMGEAGDERSDLYALGVLLFELVTGQLPYDADTPMALIMKHINAPVPQPRIFNADLPAPIEAVLVKALAKSPDDRYPAVHLFARALREAIAESDLPEEAVGAMPAALLRDRPTPVSTSSAATWLTKDDDAPTAVSPLHDQRNVYEPTIVAGAATQVSSAYDVTRVVGETAEPEEAVSGRSRTWLAVAGVVGVLLLLAGTAFAFREPLGLVAGGGDEVPTAVSTPLIAAPEDEDNDAQVDLSATQTIEAILALANPVLPSETDTPTVESDEREATPTSTASPTVTLAPTINPTEAFLASCTTAVRLITAYTSPNTSSVAAEIEQPFTMNWEIENSGTCPLPAGISLAAVSGETFDLTAPAASVLTSQLASGQRTTLSLDLTAPLFVDAYETSWQLQDSDGNPLGEPFTSEVRTYLPITPTPRVTNTPTPLPPSAATPTPELAESGPVDFNFFLGSCEYPGGGSEWRCQMTITPFGGIGPDYTIWVFDSDQPTRYFGGNQTHFIVGRRCSPWINEVKVQDEASGQETSRSVFIDPTAVNNFPGGTACTE